MTTDVLPRAVVLGRFPPPLDGQTLATHLCAEALGSVMEVRRVNTEPPGPPRLNARPRFNAARMAHFVAAAPQLRRQLSSLPDAAVLWHSISPAPLGHLRDRLATLPALGRTHRIAAVMHRASYEQLLKHPLLGGSAARLLDRLQFVIFQSETLAGRLDPWVGPGKRRIIPNTLPDDLLFSHEEIERRLAGSEEAGATKLLFLSNMLPEKGYQDVLEAARLLAKQGVPYALKMAGGWPSGQARQRADAFIQAHSLPVSILGEVQRTQVRDLHQEADLFLLPTYHPTETQPIAIIEALGAGTPVISTDRDILRDMITDGVEGRLVPARAPQAIAAAVGELSDRGKRLKCSRAARRRFETAFAPAVVRRCWRELVADLLALPS